MKKFFLSIVYSFLTVLVFGQGIVPVAFKQPSTAPIDPTLIGWWPLNINSNDTTGNGNNGSDYLITYVPGHIKGTANFSGSGYIYVADANDLKPTDYFTISMWVYPTTSTLGMLFDHQSSNPYYGYQIFYLSDHTIDCEVANNVNHYDLISSPISLNAWTLVVFVWDGSKGYIYLNNAGVDNSNDMAGPLTYNDSPHLGIGIRATQINYLYHGMIDDIRFYHRILLESDILNIYNGN
jgi:hypothetical protein